MILRGSGMIINVSSTLGRTGIARLAAYCSSKFGVLGLTQSIADEFKPHGIKVFSVCPGGTDTPLHRRAVGEEAAKLAMPSARVAEIILGLITSKIVIPSGGYVVIDDHAEKKSTLKKLFQVMARLVS
jgi:NAD(P)-dependent dehydrogenase (short-subunit alcohol dehydrogenase family)